MSIPTSALVECPNNAILYVMVLDDVEFVEIPSYSIMTVKNEIKYVNSLGLKRFKKILKNLINQKDYPDLQFCDDTLK